MQPIAGSNYRANGPDTVLQLPVEPAEYLSMRYAERLAEAVVEASGGIRGDSYDNALAETASALYSTEVIRHAGPWRGLEGVG